MSFRAAARAVLVTLLTMQNIFVAGTAICGVVAVGDLADGAGGRQERSHLDRRVGDGTAWSEREREEERRNHHQP
jgi:hypothetical protein